MNTGNLLGRLRALSTSAKLTQDELDTVMDATRAIESLRRQLGDQQREAARDARDAAAEARWQDRNDRDGVPHGSY